MKNDKLLKLLQRARPKDRDESVDKASEGEHVTFYLYIRLYSFLYM